MATLLDMWRTKHEMAAYVLRSGKPAVGLTVGPMVQLGEGASFARFRKALENGTIVVDPAIWFSPDQRVRKFRIRSE